MTTDFHSYQATKLPSAIYVWLVPSEQVQEQPGSWRIRKWDIEPFPEANFTLQAPETGNTPTERKPSAEASGKPGTEARHQLDGPSCQLTMPRTDEIKLACGEMTAQELRTVKAVLGWFIRRADCSHATNSEAR